MATPHTIPETLPEIDSELARLDRESQTAADWLRRMEGRLRAHYTKQAEDAAYRVLLQAKRIALVECEKKAA